MYNCTSEVINLLKKHYRQVARITISRENEDDIIINESDILQGGLTIDRYSSSGDKIEIGSAIAAELTLKLKNYDGKFNDVSFEGLELFVEIGVKKWDAHRWENAQLHYVPCGKYVIDTPPRTKSTITISALDYMTKLDKYVDMSEFTFPMTIIEIVEKVCQLCGVTLATTLTGLPNASYSVASAPETEMLTYRTLIRWCAFVMATNAFFNANGQLEFSWYSSTDVTITSSDRYYSDLYEKDITVTGLEYTSSINASILKGTDAYALSFTGCDIIQDNPDTVLTNIYLAVKDFTYRPFEATIKPAPYLYPMDKITFVDKNDNSHVAIISHITFTMNTNTSIAGRGETNTNNSYAVPNGLTAQEKVNVGSSNGLYKTTVIQPDLSEINFIHDKPLLSQSKLVIRMTAEGIGISNDGGNTWDYSFNFVTGTAIAGTIQSDNAWIADLFAQNIIATGTISGLTLEGTRLKTVSEDNRQVDINRNYIHVNDTETDEQVIIHADRILLDVENLSDIGEDTGIVLKDLSAEGSARLKTIPFTNHLGYDFQGFAFQCLGDESAGMLFRIPEVAKGVINLTAADYNTTISTFFFPDHNNAFDGVPNISLTHKYADGIVRFQGDIEIVDVGVNAFDIRVNATSSDTQDMIIYWTAIY